MNARRNLKTKATLAVIGVALIASGIAYAAGMILTAGKLGIFASGATIATPTVGVSFPVAGNSYNATGFDTGCPTAGFCGTATAVSPDTVSNVKVAIRRGTGNYWDGSLFTSATPVLLTATGTTSWSYGFTAANFTADDAYTVTAVATTSAGSTVSTNTTFTIDRVAPPAPSITSAPSTPTTDTGATFSFSDTEGGVAFECKLDAGSFASCTSSNVYSGLADGSHTFRVRALDAAGNASTEATHTWVVDTTPPSTVLTFPASSAYNTSTWNSGCSSAICGTASDASSGIAEVKVSIRQSSGSYWNGTSFGSDTEMFFTATGTTTWSFAFPASNFPAEGPYTVRAKSTDATGHESSVTSKTTSLDNTAPSAADIQTSKTSGGSTNGKAEAGDSILYTFSEEMSPASIMSGWSGATTNVVVRLNNLADDTVTVYDSTNTTQLNLGTVDLHRPGYVTADVTFGASGTPSTMTLNGSGITIVLGTVSNAASVGTVTATDTMRWTPSASATDIAGNAMTTTVRLETGTADYEFSAVSATAAITYPTSGTFSAASFNDGCGTTDIGDICGTAAFPRANPLVQVSIRQMGSLLYWDGTGFNSFSEVLLTATGTTSWSYSFAGSNFTADGDYTVRVLSSDSGVTTATASSTFTLETVAPTPVITFPAASIYGTTNWNNGCSSTICGTASDASGIATVKVSIRQVSTGLYWNGTSFAGSSEVLNTATGTTSWSYAFAATSVFPAEGYYTVRAVATDTPGNTGSTSVTFLSDKTVPTTAITFPVNGASYNTASFDAGCSTSPGDVCGTGVDAGGFGGVYITIQQGAGNYWNGSSFSSASAVYIPTTGTTNWSYPFAGSNFLTDGPYTVNVIAQDAGGNIGAFSTSVITIDSTAPSVSSINRSSATPTNASSVSWAVTFSESVTGVDASDFSLTSSGLGGTPAITNVSGSGSSYTVTASAGTGNGTLGLNLTTSATVTDLAGNAIGSSGFTGQVYTFDRDLPSSTLTHPAVDAAHYNASGWTNGGCSAGTGRICGTATDATNAVTSVELSIQKDGGANSYWDGAAFTAPETFMPATGTTSWALQLASSKLLNGSTYLITVRTTDAAGNVDSSMTRSFTYDTAVPFVSSITGPAATVAATLDYTVTFSESVAPVAAGDFSLTTTGVVGASITGISGSGSTRTVTVATGIGTGTIRVNLADGDASIKDLANNTISPTTFTTGTTVAVDRTAPPAPAITYPSTTYTGPTAWLASCSTPAVDDFCGTATDTGGAGVGTVEVSIQQGLAGNYWNGTSFSSILPVYNLASGTATWDYAMASTALTNNVQYTIVARTTDAVDNVGTTTSWTFTWDGTAPTATITVPAYSITGPTRYDSGCGTPTTGDMCGTASDALSGVSTVQISIKDNTTNKYWDGGGWGTAGGPEDWRTATGTTSWTYAIDESKFLNTNSYTVRVRSVDAGANASTIQSFTYTWDDVIPGASAVATANVGATDGKAEAGDTITFTYTEMMDPTSIRSTWDGTLTTVTVRLNNDDAVLNRDYVTIWGATNTTQFEIGRLNLNRTDYVTGAVGTYRIDFSNSTIVQNGAVITVTLGTPNDISRLGTAGGNSAAPWTPSAVAYDMAGNASTTATKSTPSEKAF